MLQCSKGGKMCDVADAQETAPPKYRSLRIRPTRVDYSEDEGDEKTTTQSKDKKRGAKRKAELNIESLYCQENVKDICPTSLETIFESPQKEKNRSRIRTSKYVESVSEMSTKEQVMSVKKWKRFCSFANYYNPPKQKTKGRKDRAKKLKQLTGVKVPKGIVSDQDLKTVLAVLSDDEDQIENILNGTSDKCTLSFYNGNVIRPDIEDTSINDVIKNISAMQVVNEDGDEKVVLPHILLKDFDGPLLFSDEKDNPKPLPPQEKRSRRRSERFSGCLLPPSKSTSGDILSTLPVTNEVEECSKLTSSAVDLQGRLEDEKFEYLNSNKEQMMDEINQVDVKSSAKRRSGLNDKKVVKKSKWFESTLKRQNDSNDEQCLKKRGNVMDKDGKAHIIGHSKGNILNRSTISMQNSYQNVSDMPVKLSENQSPEDQRLGNSGSVQLNETTNETRKGRRRSKRRRVSGVKRPLYRTILEPPSLAELESASQNSSPNSLDKHSYVTHWLNTSGDPLPVTNHTSAGNVSSLSDDVPKISQSPSSPCTQMAALSLQTDQEAVSSSLSLNELEQAKPKRMTRRKSERMSIGSVVKTRSFNISMSGVESLPSESSSVCSNKVKSKGMQDFTEISNEKCDISQKVQEKKRGRQLMNMFSQLELRNDSKEEIKPVVLTNDLGAVDLLSRDKREFAMNKDDLNSNPLPGQMLANCKTASKTNSNFAVNGNTSCEELQDVQTKDMALSDDKGKKQLHSLKKTCTVEPSVPPLTCNVKSKKNTSNHCDTPHPDSYIHNSQHEKNVSKTFISINEDNQIIEEDMEWNSPIITGMFKNKADLGAVGSLSRVKREFAMNSKDLNSNPLSGQMSANCKTASNTNSNFAINANTRSCEELQYVQTNDMALSDDKGRKQLHSLKKTCTVESSVPPLTCTVKSEKNTSNNCNTPQRLTYDVKNVSKTLRNINEDNQIIEEDIEWNSPIITGMFKNKAGVRCGKIYRNRASAVESPIILQFVHNPQYKDCPPNSDSGVPCDSDKM